MTFDDLKFESHYAGVGMRAIAHFPNRYGVSIVGGSILTYGDGLTTFEVAVMYDGKLCYTTPITDNVLGWQTKEDVTQVLQQVEALPSKEEGEI